MKCQCRFSGEKLKDNQMVAAEFAQRVVTAKKMSTFSTLLANSTDVLIYFFLFT